MTTWLTAAMVAAACAVSPIEDRAPGVIGPMAGQEPAWIIDGASGHWSGADQVIKSLWIFSRKASGSLRITGHRLDGDGTLRFQNGYGALRTDALEIADPWHSMGWPGNASTEIRAMYAFLPNYVIYPSRGCWEITVQLGADATRITLEIK
jgi:hypothetical protein